MPGPATRRYSPRRPREERRDQLLDAALTLVDAAGFERVSVEGVAREAGLAKSVVYATFGSRDELVQALVSREADRAIAEIALALGRERHDHPDENMLALLTAVLEAVAARPASWRLFLLPAEGMPAGARAEVSERRGELLGQIRGIVAWGLERFERPDVDVELAAEFWLASFEHAARLSLADPARFPIERLTAFAAAFASIDRSVGR